jgi:hypothetical protein
MQNTAQSTDRYDVSCWKAVISSAESWVSVPTLHILLALPAALLAKHLLLHRTEQPCWVSITNVRQLWLEMEQNSFCYPL